MGGRGPGRTARRRRRRVAALLQAAAASFGGAREVRSRALYPQAAGCRHYDWFKDYVYHGRVVQRKGPRSSKAKIAVRICARLPSIQQNLREPQFVTEDPPPPARGVNLLLARNNRNLGDYFTARLPDSEGEGRGMRNTSASPRYGDRVGAGRGVTRHG